LDSEQGNEPGQQGDRVSVTFIAVLQYYVSLSLRLSYKIELGAHALLNSQNKGSKGLIFNLVQSSFVIVIATGSVISFRDGWH